MRRPRSTRWCSTSGGRGSGPPPRTSTSPTRTWSGRFERRRVASRIARGTRLLAPVDREEWGPAPTTVNCLYNPMLNQLTVEGASLAAPSAFEDPAVLLGRYGSIIGHELGHALDSRGSQRDELGRVRDWWSADDRAAFEERAARVVADVDGCHPRGIEDAVVDGRLVGFEVVAELVSYQIAWDTYASMTTADERATPVDGFTGAQRFFLAKTYGRRGIDRPETARARLHGDVHPPFEVFANLARHLDAFHEAFATRPGDGMWLDPEDRVRVY
ncbi:M13-type metalloendopeptidase [Arsenicicoccus bolidensis]|uniref:M13-type metalloendopeptidase n=1 Tax=Arsenicicoccus bolidensis TaxID=229480 RepID=UPI0023E452EE|nr:M13-type metalloendopeptidase [Arsenicicoccus bolidensis]